MMTKVFERSVVAARSQKWAISVTFVGIALSGCGRKEVPEIWNPDRLHADQEVVMSSDAYGCESPVRFLEAMNHRDRHELSAWAEIVDDTPYCFYGADLKPGQTWTVMQIRGEAMQIAQTTTAQFEQDRSRYKHAYWTATKWGRPDLSPRAASAP